MKKSLSLPVLALAGGIAAFALRLLHLHTGFEPGTLLPIPGAPAGIALPILLAVLFAFFALQCKALSQKTDAAPVFPTDFTARDAARLTLPVAGILLIAAAGLADLYEGVTQNNLLFQLRSAADPLAAMELVHADAFPAKMQLVLGLLSFLTAGALFPVVSACRTPDRWTSDHSTLLLVPPITMIVRLVIVYRQESINPFESAYYVELLALALLVLGFYRLSSFAFSAGNIGRFALYTCFGTVLCLTAIADTGANLSSPLLYVGGSAVLLGFFLLLLLPDAPALPTE